jgi:hypothetical protein
MADRATLVADKENKGRFKSELVNQLRSQLTQSKRQIQQLSSSN